MIARALAIIVLAWSAVAVARPAARPATRPAAQLDAIAGFGAEPAVRVVQVAVGGTGTDTIVLRNDGASTIAAAAIAAEPGCDDAVHLAPLGGFTLAPGATRSLVASCTGAPAGIRRCGYRVRDASGNALLAFEAACASAGVAALAPDAALLDLGSVAIGSTKTRDLVLTNTGPAIDRLAFVTTDLAGQFSIAAPCNPDARACDASIHTVAANATTRVTVACAPRALGAQTAQLYITSSAGTRLASPIALSCTGTAAAGPVLAATPSIVDVGAVEVVNGTAQTTVQLANVGASELALLDVQIVNAGTAAAVDWTYTAGAPCGSRIPDACPLPANVAVDLQLAFDPSAIAVRDATLLINYHDTTDRSLSIPLRGVGRAPTLDLVDGATTIDFGTLAVGATANLAVRVANHGNRDLTDAAVSLAPGGPLALSPSGAFDLATGSTATFIVTCAPTAAGTYASSLLLTAPDVPAPPPVITVRCAADASTTHAANPPSLQFGEVRIGSPVTLPLLIAGPAPLVSAASGPAVPITVAGLPATTLAVTADPIADRDLTSKLTIAPATGTDLVVPITGRAVTVSTNVPDAVSLGTFCVYQPTTPRVIPLVNDGTATLGVAAPTLLRADSPFELAPLAPLVFPNVLAPDQSLLVAVTPRRQTTAGTATDQLVWQTDAGDTQTTTLTARFADSGGAIAPTALNFADTPIHLDFRNAQQVTLQNCDVLSLAIDPPQIAAPFSIDSPNIPTMLRPGELTTFSVGFHPTKLGQFTRALTITSPQLQDALVVTLTGNGIAQGGDGDGGLDGDDDDDTSFYACDSCRTASPSSAVALLLALFVATRRRRA